MVCFRGLHKGTSDIIVYMESSAQEWLDRVNARDLEVCRGNYPGTDDKSLYAFIADFQSVADAISSQHAERHTVSFAFLVASASKAAGDWLYEQHCDILPKSKYASNSTHFMLHVLAPAVNTSVKITRVTLHVSEHNARVLRVLEQNYPTRVPCSIDAFVLKGFRGRSDWSDSQKIDIVKSVSGHVTRASMTEAVKSFIESNNVVDVDSRDEGSTSMDIRNILNRDGEKIGECRTSDNFVNVSSILRTCGVKYSRYMHSVENTNFCASIKLPGDKESIEVPGNDQSGTIWAHHKRASHIADWCEFDEMVEALAEFVDDTIPVVIIEDEIPDRESYQTLNFGDVKATRRQSDLYVQATELCLNMGKTYGNSIHSETFKRKKRELSRRLGIPEAKLIKTGVGKNGSVWMQHELGLVIVEKHKPDLLHRAKAAFDSGFVGTATIINVKDANGKLISRIRTSDGFHDVNTITAGSQKMMKFSAFMKLKDAQLLVEKVKREYGKDVSETLSGIYAGNWNHPEVAKEFADKTEASDVIFGGNHIAVDTDIEEIIGENGTVTLGLNPSDGEMFSPPNEIESFVVQVTDNGYILNGQTIRKTDDVPARLSVYDLIAAVIGRENNQSCKYYTRLCEGNPEVVPLCHNFKFVGQGQRPTPVTDARGMVMIINLLPGSNAAKFRASTAEVLVRYLGGDKTLIEEINRNAVYQESVSKNDIGGIFGEAVKASTSISRRHTSDIKSIMGKTVPSDLPGAYLTLCSNPDPIKFVFNDTLPEGRVPVGFGWSGTSKRERVELQHAQTGDYMYLDGFDTVHGYELEKEMKAFARHSGFRTIHGTFTDSNGNKKTKKEFWSLNADEYRQLYEHASSVLESIERRHESSMFVKSTNKITETISSIATACVLVAKERTHQEQAKLKAVEEVTKQEQAKLKQEQEKVKAADKEIEILKLRLQLAKTSAPVRIE